MFKTIKKLFGDGSDLVKDAALEHLAETQDWKRKCERYSELYSSLLVDYEALSKKYFALKLSTPGRFPEMRGGLAPKCVRRSPELSCFFRLHVLDDANELSKFLRASRMWEKEEDPDVQWGYAIEGGTPIAWFENENGVLVEIPEESVLVVGCSAPKTDWLVVPEKFFNTEWLVV